MNKQDLTPYGDSELYQQFQNVEWLYRVWLSAINSDSWDRIVDLCDTLFVYSEGQLDDLAAEFANDVESLNK